MRICYWSIGSNYVGALNGWVRRFFGQLSGHIVGGDSCLTFAAEGWIILGVSLRAVFCV